MNIAVAFLIIYLFLLLPDAYIVFGVINNFSWWWKALFLLPTVVYIAVIIKLIIASNPSQSLMNLVLWLTLGIFFPILIFTIISLLGKLLGLAWHVAPMVFNWIGLAGAIFWLVITVYGSTVGWKKVEVVKEKFSFSSLPSSFNGYKIVQLSDFHIGTYSTTPETVEYIIDKVNSLNPDLIVFTGDLVNNSPDEIKPFVPLLSKLKAKDGVISILGNHDYCLYKRYDSPDGPQKALEGVVELEKESGWTMLRNETLQIRRGNDSIAVIGVENAGDKHFIDRSDLKKALKNVPENEFKILLSHDPTHWRREVLPKSNIDLTLSGHTHGMQFKLGNFTPSKWTYNEWGGQYNEGERTLYVSTGIGGNVAFRFGVYPKIILITLENKHSNF